MFISMLCWDQPLQLRASWGGGIGPRGGSLRKASGRQRQELYGHLFNWDGKSFRGLSTPDPPPRACYALHHEVLQCLIGPGRKGSSSQGEGCDDGRIPYTRLRTPRPDAWRRIGAQLKISGACHRTKTSTVGPISL